MGELAPFSWRFDADGVGCITGICDVRADDGVGMQCPGVCLMFCMRGGNDSVALK